MEATQQRAASVGRTALSAISLLFLFATQAHANAMPMAFAGGDLVALLKESGEAPVRTVSCVGAKGSGKSTLMRSMFGDDETPAGLALLEARSSVAFVPESNEFEVGTGQAMVSLAVSDATIYNVFVHDLIRPDALTDVQVRTPDDFKRPISLYSSSRRRTAVSIRRRMRISSEKIEGNEDSRSGRF